MKAHQSNPNAQTLELPASELQDLQAIALGLDRLKAPDLEHPKIIYLLRKRSFCSFFLKSFLAQDELLVERVVRPFDQKIINHFTCEKPGQLHMILLPGCSIPICNPNQMARGITTSPQTSALALATITFGTLGLPCRA